MRGPAYWRAGTPGSILRGRWFTDPSSVLDEETEFEIRLGPQSPEREPDGWKGYHLEEEDSEHHWDPLYRYADRPESVDPLLVDPAEDDFLNCLKLLERHSYVFCDARDVGDYFLRALHTMPFRGWLQTSDEEPPYYRPDRPPFGRTGEEPTVVMTHGYTGDPDNWTYLAEEFESSGNGCAVPLLPGHGLPPETFGNFNHMDWIKGLGSNLNWLLDGGHRLIGVGLSMGGALNLIHWRKFDAIVTINAPYYMPDWRRFFLPVLQWLKTYHRFEESDKTIPVRSLLNLGDALGEMRDVLEDVDVPVLVINHREDDTVSVNHGVRYCHAIPDSNHVVLDEGIHESPTDPDVARTLRNVITEWLHERGFSL